VNLKFWYYINDKFIDNVYGEWYDMVDKDGQPYKKLPKFDEWKCPYHNSRAMIELIERIDNV
jgi:cellobiose epimerase